MKSNTNLKLKYFSIFYGKILLCISFGYLDKLPPLIVLLFC